MLADFDDDLRAFAIPGINDHRGVWIDLELSAPIVESHDRECFNYAKANWDSLYTQLENVDWTQMPDEVDAAASFLTDSIMTSVRAHVPNKMIKVHKSSHPWLDEKCLKAIQSKLDAFDTSRFPQRRDECSQSLREARFRYVRRTSEKLISMKASSKQWWKLANSLLRKPSGTSSIPPLKRSDGTWARDSVAKAELLAETFSQKSKLSEANVNEYTPVETYTQLSDDKMQLDDVSLIEKCLLMLDESSGTGPDQLAARVLRRCREVLAKPIIIFYNRIII